MLVEYGPCLHGTYSLINKTAIEKAIMKMKAITK